MKLTQKLTTLHISTMFVVLIWVAIALIELQILDPMTLPIYLCIGVFSLVGLDVWLHRRRQ